MILTRGAAAATARRLPSAVRAPTCVLELTRPLPHTRQFGLLPDLVAARSRSYARLGTKRSLRSRAARLFGMAPKVALTRTRLLIHRRGRFISERVSPSSRHSSRVTSHALFRFSRVRQSASSPPCPWALLQRSVQGGTL